MENKPLLQSIQKTLAYFDIFDCPLTKEELFANLWRPDSADNYEMFLNFLDSAEAPPQKFGYYFLAGREQIIERRRQRLLYSEKKLKIARRASRLVAWLPFVRAVFLCNTAALGIAEKESDVDFLIIARRGRIFLARFFATLVLHLFCLRRHGKKITDRVCLSFYLTDDNLNLATYRAMEGDIHFAYWIFQTIPLFDPGGLHLKFLRANSWADACLPHLSEIASATPSISLGCAKFWIKKFLEKIWGGAYGDILEKQAKAAQLAKIKISSLGKIRAGKNDVVIADNILKFHEYDRREEYKKEWEERLRRHPVFVSS